MNWARDPPPAHVGGGLQLIGRHLRPRAPRSHRMLLHFALPDLGATEGVERVLVLAAEGDAGDAGAVGDGEDYLGRTIIGADLNAAARRAELTALERVADALGAGVVVPVGDVQGEESFLVRQFAIAGDLIAVDPLRVPLGHRQQPLVGAVGQAGRELDAGRRPAAFGRP
jgi:hypothetical protein